MEENTIQERRHLRENVPQMLKLQIPNHQDKSASEQQPQDESVSEQQPQDESVSEQQPQDESVSEQQLQDESVSEQQQGMTAAEQPQDKASDTLMSQSSDDSISLPDYGTALKTFTMKDPSSVPKKPRYSLQPKTDNI